MSAAIFLICLALIAHGSGRPHLDLAKLAAAADAILVADVSRGEPKRQDDGSRYAVATVTVHVQTLRSLKGNAPKDLEILATHSNAMPATRVPRAGVRLVFLHFENDQWSFLSPYYPDFPAVQTQCQYQPAVTDPNLQGVLCEIASVFASPDAIQGKQELLSVDFALPPGPYLVQALETGVANANDRHMMNALRSELLFQGDVSQLATEWQTLLSGSMSPDERGRFLYVLRWHLSERGALPTLKEMLTSTDPQVRIAAAWALWHIRDASSMPEFKKALNDDEPDVQYAAVRGLADLTGENLWGPSGPEWEQNRQKYLKHWRDWAAQR